MNHNEDEKKKSLRYAGRVLSAVAEWRTIRDAAEYAGDIIQANTITLWYFRTSRLSSSYIIFLFLFSSLLKTLPTNTYTHRQACSNEKSTTELSPSTTVMRANRPGSRDGSRQFLPGLRLQHSGLNDSASSSLDASVSDYSSVVSSASNMPAMTPVASTVGTTSVGDNTSARFSQSNRDSPSFTPLATPVHTSLQSVSSFKAQPSSKRGSSETVKFLDQGQEAGGDAQRAGRAVPVRVVIGMQGTVLPEHHGGLPKMGHIAVAYQQALYVFGGVNAKGQYTNHVFCHEKRNLAWHEIRGVGVVPRGRANHAAVLVESKLYIFGGHRQLDVFDDLFAYDIPTSRWEKISYEQSQGPGGVFLHAMVHIPTSESLFVVGGIHHREQNSYIGHLFDIRNRVWSGVPPPPTVNPQHLQLVSAAFHEASNSVVVLGLAENNAAMRGDGAGAPCVYLFHSQSFAWRRVETPTAPESPLPFRIDAVWGNFLHFLVTSGGGLYDPVLQDWIFPFPLSPSRSSVTSAGEAAGGKGGGHNALAPPPPPPSKLGFLILSLREMSWSLVLCKFPRKLLAEVKTYNTAERVKVERSLTRVSGAAAVSSAGGSSHRSSASVHGSRNESGVLNLAGLSRTSGGSIGSIGGAGAGAGAGVGAGAFGQRLQRHHHSMSSSLAVTWGANELSSDASLGARGSVPRAGGLSHSSGGGAVAGVDRYRRLINFHDVPEFARKFVLVAVRDAPLKNSKPRSMQYMVLHGGLVEPTDYTMLAFRPRLTRVDALAATKQNGQLAGLVRTASYRTLRSTRNTTAGNIDFDSDGDDDESSYKAYSPMVDTESFTELIPSAAAGGTKSGGTAKKYGDTNAISFASMEDTAGESFSVAFRNSASEEDIGSHTDTFGDGRTNRLSSLLPTLPRARNTGNCPRFAMQYAPQNALHGESLLPYAQIPVAVLQTTQDVHKWSKNYYSDQRRWLSERLKEALTEDRKLRRLRKIANAHSGRPTSSSGGTGRRNSRNSVLSDDISFGDTDSLMESMFLLESMTNVHRASRGEKKSSTLQAFEDQLAMEAAVAAVENKEAPKRRVQDFFEERRLEPFVAEDVAQLPRLNNSAATAHANNSSTSASKKSKKKQSVAPGLSKSRTPKKVAGAKHGSSKNTPLPLAAAAKRAPHSQSPLPSSIATVVGVSPAASVGYERYHMKPKRLQGRSRRASTTVLGGVDAGHSEIARAASQLLLQSALDRFRADDDHRETRQRKARLRWRFVRALVCTGEAAYLLHMASQAQSKMKGVAVSSSPGLVLAPELHLVGPSQAYKVPSKPVPYNVSAAVGGTAASTATSSASNRATQVTSSGMVVYRSIW